MSKPCLRTRIHESDLLWQVCKTVTYVGFPFRELYERMKPLVEKYGTRKVSYALSELLSYAGGVAHLNPEARKACFTVLGPVPEQWDTHYRDWQDQPVKRPPEHQTPPVIPSLQADPFLESLTLLSPEELLHRYKVTRKESESNAQAARSEMLRRGIDIPAEEPSVSLAADEPDKTEQERMGVSPPAEQKGSPEKVEKKKRARK